MSPAQIRTRLDDVMGKVNQAADLVRAGEMAAKALAPDERDAITELLRTVADRLDIVVGDLHDMDSAA